MEHQSEEIAEKHSISEEQCTGECYQDPDYDIIPGPSPKRSKVNHNRSDAKEESIRKIKEIIQDQFQQEINDKDFEIDLIDKRLHEARRNIDKLRACIAASYYSKAGQTHTRQSSQKLSQQPSIHPEIKKNLGKAPRVGHSVQGHGNRDIPAAKGAPSDGSRDNQAHTTDESKSENKQDKPTNAVSKVPKSLPSSRDHFKVKKRIVIGNLSKYIPVERRELNDQSTHKWMVYVRGSREEPDIQHFVKKVWFFLHPSYRPNDLVQVSIPPFHLTRRGWGEFPVRVQLHFYGSQNKRVDILHHLKLDRTYTGLQTLGSETVVDVAIDMTDIQSSSSRPSSRCATPTESLVSKERKYTHTRAFHCDSSRESPISEENNTISNESASIRHTVTKSAVSKENTDMNSSSNLLLKTESDECRTTEKPNLSNEILKSSKCTEKPVKSELLAQSTGSAVLPDVVQSTIDSCDHNYDNKCMFITTNNCSKQTTNDEKQVTEQKDDTNNANISHKCNSVSKYAYDTQILNNAKDPVPSTSLNVAKETLHSIKSAVPDSDLSTKKGDSNCDSKASVFVKCVDQNGRVYLVPQTMLVVPSQKPVQPTTSSSLINNEEKSKTLISNNAQKKSVNDPLSKVNGAPKLNMKSLLNHKVNTNGPNQDRSLLNKTGPCSLLKSRPDNKSSVESPKTLINTGSKPTASSQGAVYSAVMNGQTYIIQVPGNVKNSLKDQETGTVKPNAPSTTSVLGKSILGLKKRASEASAKQDLKKINKQHNIEPRLAPSAPGKPLSLKFNSLQSFTDIEELICCAIKKFPLISPTADRSVHPYCASSLEDWNQWNVGKRRAAEWQRAAWLLKSLRAVLTSCQSPCHIEPSQLWSTKKLMIWCRQHGYSPLDQELLKKLKVLHRDRTDSFDSYSVSESLLQNCDLTTNTENTDDEYVDIETNQESSNKSKRTGVTSSPTLPPNSLLIPPSEGATFISNTTSKIGIQPKPVCVEDSVYGTATQDVLWAATKSFLDDLLRKAYSQSGVNKRLPEEVMLTDVYRAICKDPKWQFLTNQYMGSSVQSSTQLDNSNKAYIQYNS